MPGTAAGLAQALERFGSVPLADLVGPGVRLAREGAPVNAEQAYILDILAPIHERMPGHARALRAGGAAAARGRRLPLPGAGRGAGTLRRRGRRAASTAARSRRRSATSSSSTAAPSAPATSPPTRRSSASRSRAPFRGTEVLTNPPPSSGGILIAYCLGLLERLGAAQRPRAAGRGDGARPTTRRDLAFAEALYEEGMEAGFLDPAGLDLAAADLLGSTTHISVLDADGICASVTCSNGSGSGVLVPGTGVILNNMLGEEDLNPLGFHRIAPGRRVPSMMAPTVVLRDGEIVLALGSAGSNRIRSAILQTVVRAVEQGLPGGGGGRGAAPALRAGDRPGRAGDRRGGAGPARGARRRRSPAGPRSTSSSAASRPSPAIPRTGELSGGGDPRRGGAVAYAD